MSQINEKLYIEFYMQGRTVHELAELFGEKGKPIPIRTLERFETRLRRQGKIPYRKELNKLEEGKYKHGEVFEEVKVYLDNARKLLETQEDVYSDVKLKTNWDKNKQAEDLVLVWSDMHTGMINKHPLNNNVTYDEEIQKEELKSLARGVLRFHDLYKPSYNIETFYIFDLGDNVTNDRIFEGQQSEIDMIE